LLDLFFSYVKNKVSAWTIIRKLKFVVLTFQLRQEFSVMVLHFSACYVMGSATF